VSFHGFKVADRILAVCGQSTGYANAGRADHLDYRASRYRKPDFFLSAINVFVNTIFGKLVRLVGSNRMIVLVFEVANHHVACESALASLGPANKNLETIMYTNSQGVQ
jgi:hypothetical protein